MDLFTYSNYKDYLIKDIAQNRDSRGYQTRLAEAAGCKISYLSQVLNTHINFTPDHAAGLCHFWKWDDTATEYFLTLVHLARTASPLLKQRLEKQIQDLRRKNERLEERLSKGDKNFLPVEASLYYSSWYWPAIHLILGIPAYRTPQAIARRLLLSEDLVLAVLEELRKLGLVKRENQTWQRTTENLHLPKNSLIATQSHSIWRIHSIERFSQNRDNGVFYSAVHTLSRDDYEKFKNQLITFIEESRSLIDPSKDEEVIAFLCDIFPL